MERILSGKAKIQWVLDEAGALHHVDDYASIPPKDRPPVVCPVCLHLVWLHIGQERIHHAVHRAGDICAATKPETALHINCKYHLYNQLRQSNQLELIQVCQGVDIQSSNYSTSRYCGSGRPWKGIAGWDTVVVEHAVNGFRPDVALLLDGKVILALEVVVTHKISEEKRLSFEKQGIYWIEIEATEEFFLGPPQPWTTAMPLRPSQFHLPADYSEWRCPDCEKVLAETKARAEWQAELRRKAAQLAVQELPKQPKPTYHQIYRWVDIYYPSGKAFRELFTITRKLGPNGDILAAWLEKGDFRNKKTEKLADGKPPFGEATIKALQSAFDAHLNTIVVRNGWTVDSSMAWQEWPERLARNAVLLDRDVFPERYIHSDGRWQPHPGYIKVKWDDYFTNTYRYKEQINQIRYPTSQPYRPERSATPPQPQPTEEDDPIPPIPRSSWGKPAVCLICGEMRTDYWYYNGENGSCKCNSCLDRGMG